MQVKTIERINMFHIWISSALLINLITNVRYTGTHLLLSDCVNATVPQSASYSSHVNVFFSLTQAYTDLHHSSIS